MTPDERRMIEDLFQRLSQNGGGLDKDPQAERLIADLMRRSPDAAYMLVQTTLVLEYQMNEQQSRINELEDRLADLERGSQGSSGGGGSFLGGRIGSQRTATGSVPSAGGYERSGSPWGHQGGGQGRSGQSSPGFSGYEQQPPQQRGGMFGGSPAGVPPQVPQAPQGGGFLRSAMATAAGVAGGMVLANSLGGLFGGGNQAHAAGNNAALQDADRQQDELQDAQFDADAQQDEMQDASFDTGGDFDSFET